MEQQNQIFETLSPTRLFFRCALPSMASMAVIALYTIADGVFVGRFIGSDALAAINLVMPVLSISFALADMVAVGSSVQIAIRLGEKKELEASRIFTVCSLLIVGISVAVGMIGYFGAEPLLRLMGADAEVTAFAVEYTKVYAVFAPFIMVFFAVDNYLRICGRTHYSMALNIMTSLLNILLDYLFLGVLRLGIGSAALASCIGLSLGTLLGYWPFLRKKLQLRFVRGKIRLRQIVNILFNGSSEFFSNIAGSILMIILNSLLLRLAGSMAVAAFSIVLYVDSIMATLLYGMTDSIQPAISYCYGAKLRGRMFAFEKRVLLAGALLSGLTLAGMRLGGQGIIALFIRENDPALLEMSLRAMELFSFTYLTGWIGVGLSAFFTAVNRPGTSLGISIGRALFFPLLSLAVLVPLLGVDGVWLTSAVSSTLTAAAAVIFLARFLHGQKTSRARNAPRGKADGLEEQINTAPAEDAGGLEEHMIIRKETPADHEAVCELVRTAFADAEHSDGQEHELVAALRKSNAFVPGLSLVAEVDGTLVGHILFTEIRIGGRTALALAPLAVLPAYQRRGVGSALIAEGHRAARELRYPCSVVLGSEKYYPKFGYLPAERFGIRPPFDVPSENFMALPLSDEPVRMEGIVRYAKEFGI